MDIFESKKLLMGTLMLLQLGEVVEGIDLVEFAGMDDALEQVAHPRTVEGELSTPITKSICRRFRGIGWLVDNKCLYFKEINPR